MTVRRFDRGELSKPVRLPNGFLKVDAYLTRVGVFDYRQPDGKIRRELRPPEEVFAKDSLESFALAPVTNDHPLPGYLTADNAQQFATGSVGEPRADTDKVRANLQIWAPTLIADMEKGKTQVSCGYSAEIDETPGIWNGQRYDCVQRNIRGNHVAIVSAGRAGPDVRVRMDSADAVMLDQTTPDSEPSAQEKPVANRTIKIDGVDATVEETTAQLIEKQQAKADAAVSASRGEVDKEKARADAAEAELKKAKDELASAPAKIRNQIDARVALESKAKGVLGESKFDSMTDRQVRLAVLAKLAPELKADEKTSDVYVEARFDAALEHWRKENPGQDALRALAQRRDGGAQERTDNLSTAELEARFKTASRDAHRNATK